MKRIYTKDEDVPAVVPSLMGVSSAQIAEHSKNPKSNSDLVANIQFTNQKTIYHEKKNIQTQVQIKAQINPTQEERNLFNQLKRRN